MNTDKQNNSNIKPFGHIDAIDGIRGLFMMSVLLVHMYYLKYIKIPTFLAQFSLHLFFVLSAFLISSILYRQKEKGINFRSFAKDFYFKRALRILPLYWAYIGGLTFIALILHFTVPSVERLTGILYDIKHFGWMLFTFTFNYRELFAWSQEISHLRCHLFPHLWSISIEEQFYFIIPTLIYFINKKNLKRISLIVILLYPFIRIFGFLYFRDVVGMTNTINGNDENVLFSFFYRSSLFQFDAFFYGILIPLVQFKQKKTIYSLYIFFIFILIATQIYAAFLYSIEHNKSIFESITNNTSILYQYNQYMIINTLYNLVSFCLVYIAVNFPKSKFNFLYFIPLFKNIGKIVYGFYIFHAIFALLTLALYYGVLVKFIPNILADIIAISVCTFSTYFFAKLSYDKFESKFLKFRPKT